MIAKVISYGHTREEAIRRMRQALEELIVDGITTNAELHKKLLRNKDFIAGGTNIHFLEKMLASGT